MQPMTRQELQTALQKPYQRSDAAPVTTNARALDTAPDIILSESFNK